MFFQEKVILPAERIFKNGRNMQLCTLDREGGGLVWGCDISQLLKEEKCLHGKLVQTSKISFHYCQK